MKSTLNRGSEFFFTLTYKKANPTETAPKLVTKNSLGHLKILLCEDNVLNQKLAKSVINNFGFHLDIAQNGEEGIELLSQN
ncbi:hypothetical protein SB658_24900, partial [Bacillus sp. SIMBA_008]|uniref:hypothetical protein n=1 Tax=Bacillus sp. SIMBA_008 TaxID=3085757 RepID=UPI00397C308A